MTTSIRRPQVCVLGSADPGSAAYELAAEAGDERQHSPILPRGSMEQLARQLRSLGLAGARA